VYTRYWLHNKGPAPVGYLPTSVHIEPSAVSLAGPVTVRVRVAAASRDAAGVVELDVPDGLTASPARPMAYDLGAGDYAEFAVSLRADGAASGTYFVAARIRDDLGQVLEDVVAVTVGTASPPLDVSIEPAGLRLAAGERGEVAVRLANHARSEIRGEVQLLSPYGTWGGPGPDISITPWTRGFAAPPGGRTEARYVVEAPAVARTGGMWWAVVKVAYFGRVYYTPAVSIDTRSATP
jgi:alpha-mannosidase